MAAEGVNLVSIVVVAHERPDWLRECLDSIAAQDHRNLECCVVLDDDPDGALAAAVQPRFAADPRFTFHSMPRRMERNHCRNFGIEATHGRWISIVDGDDWLPADSLAVRLKTAAGCLGDTVFGRVRVWSDGQAKDQFTYQERYTFDDLRIGWPSHCTLLIDRQRLGAVRYPAQPDDGEQPPELLAGEDVRFQHELLRANPGMSLVNCQVNVYFYRRYPSTSHRLRHRSYFRVIQTIIEFHGYPDPEDRTYRKSLTEKAIYCLLHHAVALEREARLAEIEDQAEPVALAIAAWATSASLDICLERLQSDLAHEQGEAGVDLTPVRNAVVRAIAHGRNRNWTSALPGYAVPFDPQPVAADYQRARRWRQRHAGETCVLLCRAAKEDLDLLERQQPSARVLYAVDTPGTQPHLRGIRVDYAISLSAPAAPEFGAHEDPAAAPVHFVIDHLAGARTRQDPLTFHLPGTAGKRGDQSFSTDITQRLGAAGDLVYAALQLVHYLGFSRLILVGLDPLTRQPETAWARRESRLWLARQAFDQAQCEVIDTDTEAPSVAFRKQPLAAALGQVAGSDADPPPRRITYFPAFGPQDDLNFSLLRAAWYLGPIPGAVIRVFADQLPATLECFDHYDPACADMHASLLGSGRLSCAPPVPEAEMLQALRDSDAVICWKDGAYVEDVYGAEAVEALRRGGTRVFTMGAAERLESSMYVEVSFRLMAAPARVIEANRLRFGRLRARLAGRRKAFLVATGPSSRSWERFRLEDEDALTVVCNSVINDDRLMAALKPDIVTFADPIFHFGCSTYARAFRERLRQMARRHRFTIVIPFKYLALFTAQLPELAHRVIAVPHAADRDINLDLAADFRLRTTDNVLTFLMIPLAASLARELYLIGCDGRPLAQDGYFWNHNARTQFTGEMAAIRKAHPSFFQIDYNEYYLAHCDNLERYALAVEGRGQRLHSMWQSHIPALRSRLHLPAPVRNDRIIVSINPDLKDEFGHWLHYDRRLAETTGDLFVAMAHVDLAVNPPDLLALPVFTHPMRETRVDETGEKAARVGEEFRGALEMLLADLPGATRVHCIMYTGDLSYVDALEPVFASLGGRARLSVNLFFTFLDYVVGTREFAHYRERYARMLAPDYLAARPWLRLFSDSTRMAGILRQHFGSSVSFWPTVNLDVVDEVIGRIGVCPAHAGKWIVFPGNGQLSKGFDLACDFIEKYGEALAASHGCRFVLRDMARDRPEVNEDLSRKLALVAALPWVEVRSGTLSAEDFLALFWHADLIVLPYRRRHFYARTSSCVVNAVLSGVKTLVPRDTWLSEQVLKFKAGEVFADGDIDDLHTVLLRLLGGATAATDLEAARAEYDIRRLLPALIDGFPDQELLESTAGGRATGR